MDSTIKKGAYETITPPNTLAKKVRKLTGRDAQFDPVASAEQALERLSVNFGSWMEDEVQRLISLWETNKTDGFTDEARGTLYRAAHDMRGQATTLGFPLVAKIAGVFCDILDAMGNKPVPDTFLEQYITAIRAIARETNAGEDNAVAATLADELAKAGDDLIEKMGDQKAA